MTSRSLRALSRSVGGRACMSAAPTTSPCTISSAELVDNAMDEAVAGHASRIEVILSGDGSLTITDNGRGSSHRSASQVPDRSALEVILTTLHSGGKFGGKAYQDVRWAAWRRPVGGQRPVRASDRRGRPRSPAGAPVLPARRAGEPAAGLRHRVQPARHVGHRSCPTPPSSAPPIGSARCASTAWRGRRPICLPASRCAGAATRRCSMPMGTFRKRRRCAFPAG